MPSWKCSNCGYSLEAETPPEQCPSCKKKCDWTPPVTRLIANLKALTIESVKKHHAGAWITGKPSKKRQYKLSAFCFHE
ncbi:MAG: hypothetical protein JRI62_08125 [Deltaproteobacteria bacterium]|nr:hypothetical protein [Deltaproteobacteria bacterium]